MYVINFPKLSLEIFSLVPFSERFTEKFRSWKCSSATEKDSLFFKSYYKPYFTCPHNDFTFALNLSTKFLSLFI